MKPGEPPQKGVKELVLKLAGSKPRATNREIREVVQRKFGETTKLSDRTIVRYCEAAGLPTSSKKASPKAEAETQGQRLESGQAVHADPELGPHGRELFYFGQRFRDLADVPRPNKVVKMTAEEYEGAMWEGWPRGALANPPRDAEEEAVVREWGSGRRDARTHSLFVGFQQHLSGHECWESLDRMDAAFKEYVRTCPAAYEAILKQVRDRLPSVSEEREKKVEVVLRRQAITLTREEAKVVAEALLADVCYRKEHQHPLFIPKVSRQGGAFISATEWGVSLGSWFVARPSEVDGNRLVEAFDDLSQQALRQKVFDELLQAQKELFRRKEAFQGCLSPDARLRKLVLDGRCDLCPWPSTNVPAPAPG